MNTCFNILETNVAPGVPVNPSDPNSELVHFANPVINFEFTGEEKKKTVAKTQAQPIATTEEAKPADTGSLCRYAVRCGLWRRYN